MGKTFGYRIYQTQAEDMRYGKGRIGIGLEGGDFTISELQALVKQLVRIIDVAEGQAGPRTGHIELKEW